MHLRTVATSTCISRIGKHLADVTHFCRNNRGSPSHHIASNHYRRRLRLSAKCFNLFIYALSRRLQRQLLHAAALVNSLGYSDKQQNETTHIINRVGFIAISRPIRWQILRLLKAKTRAVELGFKNLKSRF